MNGFKDTVQGQRHHNPDYDVFTILGALMRRKWIPLLGLAGGLVLGLGLTTISAPKYESHAQLMITQDGASLSTISGRQLTQNIQTEVAIMRSFPVLSKAATQLKLYSEPGFANTGFMRFFVTPNESENALREQVLSKLKRMVNIGVLPGTNIIDIGARHRNPDRAAQIANAVSDAYQERKMEERFGQSKRNATWMSKRLEEVKSNVDAAKTALQKFQEEYGFVALGGADAKSAQMTALNAEVSETENEITSLTTRVEQMKKMSSSRKNTQGLSDVLQSDRINHLKSRESDLAAELADLSARYGAKHPRIQAQKAELAKMRGDIAREIKNIGDAVSQDLAIAQARLNRLNENIENLSNGVNQDGRLKMQLKSLESEVDAQTRLYNDFLLKYQEMVAGAQMYMTDIKVISSATIPSMPDQARRIAMIILLGVAGFFLGLFYVLGRILWNRSFTTAQQLEYMSHYPVFGTVPVAVGKAHAVHHQITHSPAAILAESLRSLRVSLRLRNEVRGELSRRPRVIAFTSTLPDEGKTSLAVMLAMVAAKSGERVCIVDCDLRKPSLHKAFGIGNAKGLPDYLSARYEMDEVIYRKDPSGIHLVTARSVPSYSLTLLTSGRMETMLGRLREQYDLVILDAPSSLAFADARVLAKMVDQTMYVVAWNKTRRESVLASLKNYHDMAYTDLALVLNKVDLKEYLRDSASAVLYQYGVQAEVESESEMFAA